MEYFPQLSKYDVSSSNSSESLFTEREISLIHFYVIGFGIFLDGDIISVASVKSFSFVGGFLLTQIFDSRDIFAGARVNFFFFFFRYL